MIPCIYLFFNIYVYSLDVIMRLNETIVGSNSLVSYSARDVDIRMQSKDFIKDVLNHMLVH